MSALLENIVESLRAAAFLDLLLVAALFFVVISWVRSAQSGSAARRLMALVFLYGLVYLAVDFFELYLVQRVLGVLFFVVLIALVVVFQGDIRRLLDRLGSVGLRRAGGVAPTSPVYLLTEATAQMAESRTGALIAIRGDDPWESHLQGGIELNGKLSRPLLHSIFNPSSPGHDGAMLLEGDRVTRFGVHLPLARRPPAISKSGGTRHTAALGLAEECDALVIVVSEERGTVSIAENGELVETSAPSELGERLTVFWENHYDRKDSVRRTWWSRRSLETGALSIGLAAMVWFLFVYSADTVFRSYRVPVEIRNLPAAWTISGDRAPSVLVTLSGSDPAFDRLQTDELAVSFDLSEPLRGVNELTITEDNLPLPAGLDLAVAEPRSVQVQAMPQRLLTLPVRVRAPEGLTAGDTLVMEPATVDVLIPEDLTDVPEAIYTGPFELESLTEDGTTEVPLILPTDVRLAPDERSEVEVRLQASGALPASAARPPGAGLPP